MIIFWSNNDMIYGIFGDVFFDRQHTFTAQISYSHLVSWQIEVILVSKCKQYNPGIEMVPDCPI